MKPPIFVRTLSKKERKALQEGLRSKDAFVLRRCQILLASARGEIAPQIAENLGCASQTVRHAIHDFNRRGVDALVAGSSRPKQTHTAFGKEQTEALKELLHHSPREFSPREFARDSTLWTLVMAAQVSFEEGITEKRVSAETIRATLARLGKGWQRAKHWIESPDPEYERKRGSRSADPAGRDPPRVGSGFRGRDLVLPLRETEYAFLG